MTSDPARSALRPYWLVGLTGHRHLHDPQRIGAALVTLLTSLRDEVDGGLGCVSSLAIGADTLFVRAALSLSLPWRALLPVPKDDFRQDFEDQDWAVAEQLLAQAVEIEVGAAAASRDEAYLECGLDTVDESDVLLAIWDEKPARGTGGTAEIVAYARSLKKPLIVLNPESLAIRREGFDGQPFTDRGMEYLNALPEPRRAFQPLNAGVPENLTRFFAKVDRMASRMAPHFRRWVASSIVMNSCATILMAWMISFALHLPLLEAAIFITTVGALVAVVHLKFRRVHEKWIRCRVAAEICRSAAATWELPRLVLPDPPGSSKMFARLTTSIRMLHLCRKPPVPAGLELLRQHYLERRIEDQAGYHRARSTALVRTRGRLVALFWVCSGLAVAREFWVGIFGTAGLSPEMIPMVSHFLPLALPCAAGCALALISVFDINRQLASSRALEDFLASARDQAAACETVPALRRVIERTERFLARETADWYTLREEPRYG